MYSSTSNSLWQPPMRDGVSASQVYLPNSDATTVFEYLCQEFSHIAASEWQRRFEQQLIFDQSGRVLTQHSAYLAHTHIFYYRFLAHEAVVPFQEKILFENEHLLVVDKPHFLTVSPTGQYVQQSLLVRLKKATQNPELSPIHRLDRETAGVILFAKQARSRAAYQQLFAEALVEKQYHAIAPYRADLAFPLQLNLRMVKSEPFYTMRMVDGPQNSRTRINLIERQQDWAKYLLCPETGKQHQLRVHLNHLGIPIRNDRLYPHISHKAADDFSHPLQLLAKQIRFQDPFSGTVQQYNSHFNLSL
ncbi:pseudouridine synthase [Acinetobacter larvae]|uniref:Pseudouridylate synthase n=1 Tax=Acinetobacter larvae TaxID=1789224 RepID=A0A1B2LZY5_9GAMM|nr:pseudouridine synthase [Acinetobacter larvae]AOA58500.1 pseudouridylate synthase [Acinetobacter larvae]